MLLRACEQHAHIRPYLLLDGPQASKLLKGAASQLTLLREQLLPLKRPVTTAATLASHTSEPGHKTDGAATATTAATPAAAAGKLASHVSAPHAADGGAASEHAHDLEPELLKSLEHLALAQAQVRAWFRGVEGRTASAWCMLGAGPGVVSRCACDASIAIRQFQACAPRLVDYGKGYPLSIAQDTLRHGTTSRWQPARLPCSEVAATEV